MDLPISFVWVISLLDGVLERGGDSGFCGYVETNAELLCV
jgi:hypothetical protein